ncbi:MAG: enoyl-CoA hydratase/isomerase family protein [Pirellulales bacterium]|nr:enoyl-CoA hydratase/isomerase family protein [Pirellulales bacterium]
MQEQQSVLTTVHEVEGGAILEIVLNRPEVHNSVNGATAQLLLAAWRRFQNDPHLTVAVLRGAGDAAFCAGADLSGVDSIVDMFAAPAEVDRLVREGTGPMGGSRLVQVKPVITVSQGFTYAGGLELFCHGHIRLAEPQATFSVACRRWGVPLVDGGTVYLPRLLAWGAALPLIITGQRIDAQRAYEIGLVWELVAQGQGPARALEYAEQICRQPRDALFADLASAVRGSHLPLESALELEARNLHPVLRSTSMYEGVARFLSGERSWFK